MTTTENIGSPGQIEQQVSFLVERRRYDAASALLATGLAQYPDHSDLLYQSALIDSQIERKERALETVQQVLLHDPDHFAGRVLLAQLYEDDNQLAKAELVLIDLLREYPEQAWLYAKYSLLMYRALHIKKARALAEEALRLDPDCENALIAHMLGNMIEGRSEAAKATLGELMEKHPENISTAYMLIAHLNERGKYAAAKRIAIEVLQRDPNSRDTLDMVMNMDHRTHWTMLPLYPLIRWGWTGSIVFYVATVLLLSTIRKHAPEYAGTATIILLVYVVYSWVYPPLLERWLKWRLGLK
jgi:tetratricopeptide (TPR) repeat protein